MSYLVANQETGSPVRWLIYSEAETQLSLTDSDSVKITENYGNIEGK